MRLSSPPPHADNRKKSRSSRAYSWKERKEEEEGHAMESLEFSQQQQTDARRNLEELLPYFTYNFITTALTTSNNFQPPHHKQQG